MADIQEGLVWNEQISNLAVLQLLQRAHKQNCTKFYHGVCAGWPQLTLADVRAFLDDPLPSFKGAEYWWCRFALQRVLKAASR